MNYETRHKANFRKWKQWIQSSVYQDCKLPAWSTAERAIATTVIRFNWNVRRWRLTGVRRRLLFNSSHNSCRPSRPLILYEKCILWITVLVRYCQFISEKPVSNLDVVAKLQAGIKSLQILPLYEELVEKLSGFIHQALTELPSVQSKLKQLLIACDSVYQESKTQQPTSMSSRIETLRKVKNRDELKRQLQVFASTQLNHRNKRMRKHPSNSRWRTRSCSFSLRVSPSSFMIKPI